LESGDIAGGVGTTLGAAATLLAGAKAPAAADTVANIADQIPGKAIVTAPVRAGARAVEAVANSKLKPFAKVMTPADEAAASLIKVPGRDFGLPPSASAPPPPAASPLPEQPLPGEVAQPADALPGAPEAAPAAASGAGIPRTLSGESALRDVLSRQDNANLTRIAKSRGINITQESQLKPSIADKRLINKIIDDYDDDELDGFRSTYAEQTRMPRHDFGDIGPEGNKTLAMQTYFPDVKIPATVMKRTQAAIADAQKAAAPAPAASSGDDLTAILQESLKRAQQQKQVPVQ
jgi:hypothetical protein